MNRKLLWGIAGLCVLAMVVAVEAPISAQTAEVKEKPPMYSYVGNWVIPRAQWADMDKQNAANQKNMEQAMADGTLVAYGNDATLVHEIDGETHDTWWSSMSMAGLLNVLEQAYKSGNATSPVFVSATKHWDAIYVSRYYNWHPGSYKDVYGRVAFFTLKKDAPPDAVDTLSKNLWVPMLEKLLADGAIHEYEIDTENIHTTTPNVFAVVILAANGAGLDKFNEAVRGLMKTNPMAGPALGSMVDMTAHRDLLLRTNATFK